MAKAKKTTTVTPEPAASDGKLEDGNVFLGPFEGDGKGGETVRATFDFDKGAATGVITFDFVQLDSWDDSADWGLDERLVVHEEDEALGDRPELLDDRFDLFLQSPSLQDAEGLDLISGGYDTFGNDGLHYNSSVNAGGYTDTSGNIRERH